MQSVTLLSFAQSGLGTNQCTAGDVNPFANQSYLRTDSLPSSESTTQSTQSSDPNEIIGLEGYNAPESTDTLRWVAATQSLAYTIYFENDPELAMAAASKVTITVPLHEKLNYATFGVGSFGFGSYIFAVEGSPSSYQTRIDLRDSLGIFLDVVAGLDIVRNEVFWIFQSIDPVTGLPPTDINLGFLPINDSLHSGEGFVNCIIKPKSDECITGDTISATASIVFDVNEAVPTNMWVNTIDAFAPTSTLTVTPNAAGDMLTATFEGEDDEGGCGIKQYKLYYSVNDSAYQLYDVYPVGDTARIPVETGMEYEFFTLAEDNVGNCEPMKNQPEYNIGTNSVTLAVNAFPQEAGTVTGGGTFTVNDTAQLSATAVEGYHFVNWMSQGVPVSTENPYSAVVSQNQTYTAYFERNAYTLQTIAVTGSSITVIDLNGNEVPSGSTVLHFDQLIVTTDTVKCYTMSSFLLNGESYVPGDTLIVTGDIVLSTMAEPIVTQTDTMATVCDSFVWYGDTLTETAAYTKTFTSVGDCDSIVTLYLTVNSLEYSEFLETACDSYVWNDSTYTHSGDYTQTFTAANGCDSIVTLHLTINSTSTTYIDSIVCEMTLPFTWNGVTFTESGVQTVTLTNSAGCDSVVVMNLVTSANPIVAVTVTDTVFCMGGSAFLQAEVAPTGEYYTYQWYKDNYLIDGATRADLISSESVRDSAYHYSVMVSNTIGCHVTAYAPAITFVFDPLVEVFINKDISCVGGSAILAANIECGVPLTHFTYNWYRFWTNANDSTNIEWVGNSAELTTTGNESVGDYAYWLTVSSNDHGCMSTSQIFNHSVISDPGVTISVVPGYPQTVCYNGESMLSANVIGGYGVPSYQWFKNGSLLVGDTNQTLLVNNLVYDVDDVYTVEVAQTGAGCANSASAAIYALISVAPSVDSFSVTACDSFIWNGVPYYESGDYEQSFQSSFGCDSTVTLHLNINHSVTEFVEITACDSYTWNDVTYSESGTYMQMFTNVDGCDSVVTLNLTIHNSTHNVQTESACESFFWHGTAYSQSGIYIYDYTNSDGCFSTDTLKLTVSSSSDSTLAFTVLENNLPFYLNGVPYNMSGTYTQIIPNMEGCDSVLTVSLTVLNNVSMSFDTTVCGSYEWNGITYTQSGDYVQLFPTIYGSDSTVTLHLTVNSEDQTDLYESVCGSYDWDGVTYTESGDYSIYLINTSGCDSIVTLHLTINHPDTIMISATACNSYSWNGVAYTESGEYLTNMTNTSGCDYVVLLRLNIHYSDTTILYATACDSYTLNGVTYTESGVYSLNLTTAMGCDSIVTLYLTINHSVTELVEVSACDSYTWNGVTYTESGEYTDYLSNVNGCDSAVTLHLTINHSDTADFYAIACNGYNWNGETYTESGDYTVHLTNSVGCDLVAILHLTVYETETSDLYVTTSDSCYMWNDITYCNTGDYSQVYQTVNGCDSIVTLHLTITVGIDNYDLSNFIIIYPNPTHNIVNVHFATNQISLSEVELQLFDTYGQYLQTVPVTGETTQVDLTGYASGIYFIKVVENGQVVAVRKVVRD